MGIVQVLIDTGGDDGADFINTGELFDSGGQQLIHRTKLFGEDSCDVFADVANRESIQEPGKSSRLAGFDSCQQIPS